MAERRMFAKTIIDSDAFLDMPLTSQCLYFHLSMRADDEGFINNPKKIVRMIGASEDDLKLLVAKHFVIPFDSGVCVIKHWRIHNYIRGDRIHHTVYQDEMSQLEVKDIGSYTLVSQMPDKCQSNVSQMDDMCQSNVSQLDDKCHTEDRLGKDRIGKVRHKYGVDANVLLTDEEYEKLKNEFPDDYEQRIDDLSMYLSSKGKTYKNHLATIRNWNRMDKQREAKKREAQEDEQTRRIQAFLDRHKEDP
jgi:hypothetical protein